MTAKQSLRILRSNSEEDRHNSKFKVIEAIHLTLSSCDVNFGRSHVGWRGMKSCEGRLNECIKAVNLASISTFIMPQAHLLL